jgi:hypothetical protein
MLDVESSHPHAAALDTDEIQFTCAMLAVKR